MVLNILGYVRLVAAVKSLVSYPLSWVFGS